MQDKMTLELSEELRQYVKALVESVVLEGGSFEDQKKYLRRFCETESIDYTQLETNLSDLFETIVELRTYGSKMHERLVRMLGMKCCFTEDEIEKLISTIGNLSGKADVPELPQMDEHEVMPLGERQLQAQEEYKNLMSDLVPDLLQKKEKLEFHLPFVKRFARESGWDGNEVASSLSDFLKMYDDFQQEHSEGEGFKSSEKKFLTFQASLAHIDQSILDNIL